ncbi:MAG: hypothetical protein ACOX5M_03305 [Bacillota bacterium]
MRAETQRWRGFPPSKFIYAFFTFNSAYSINWRDAFYRRIVTDWGSIREREKIGNYTRLFEQMNEEEAAKEFLGKLSLYIRSWADLDLQTAERELQDIDHR